MLGELSFAKLAKGIRWEGSPVLAGKHPDHLVEVVAAALRGSVLAAAIDEIAQQNIAIERIQRAVAIAQREADRSAAILLFALVEDLMLDAVKANLNGSLNGGWQALTSANGLLASASDRLSLLELLWWVRPVTASDLRLMKSIRNHFAHHADVEGFGDTKIRGWVSSMSQSESPVLAILSQEGKSPGKLSARDLYLLRAMMTVMALAMDLAVGPIATKHRVSPQEIGGKKFDEQPENLRQAMLVTAELALRLLTSK